MSMKTVRRSAAVASILVPYALAPLAEAREALDSSHRRDDAAAHDDEGEQENHGVEAMFLNPAAEMSTGTSTVSSFAWSDDSPPPRPHARRRPPLDQEWDLPPLATKT